MIDRSENRPVIALPVGDPNGIGPEIAIQSATDPAVLDMAKPVLVADRALIERTAAELGLAESRRRLQQC